MDANGSSMSSTRTAAATSITRSCGSTRRRRCRTRRRPASSLNNQADVDRREHQHRAAPSKSPTSSITDDGLGTNNLTRHRARTPRASRSISTASTSRPAPSSTSKPRPATTSRSPLTIRRSARSPDATATFTLTVTDVVERAADAAVARDHRGRAVGQRQHARTAPTGSSSPTPAPRRSTSPAGRWMTIPASFASARRADRHQHHRARRIGDLHGDGEPGRDERHVPAHLVRRAAPRPACRSAATPARASAQHRR